MAKVGMPCQVLAGVFGLAVQGLLFALCVAILIGKKLFDPRRSWREFFLDSSKQFVGAGWIHVLNLLCAEKFENTFQEGDQCEWYWINIVVDCTLGVLVEYLAFTILTSFFAKLSGTTRIEDSSFAPGNYFDPTTKQLAYSRYTKQVTLWVLVVSIMKFSMVVLMVTFHTHMQAVARGVLSPIQQYPKTKLLVVMIATPLLMNALQLILVDGIIRKQDGVAKPNVKDDAYSSATMTSSSDNLITPVSTPDDDDPPRALAGDTDGTDSDSEF